MITPQNILRHELIGLTVKIKEASDRGLVEKEGEVFDETRNMVTIKTGKGFLNIEKKGSVFSFKLPTGWVEVRGDAIVARPEDRVKKRHG